ncbi:hypothetical protein [Acetobacter thailandicus]|uniref:hypothetical protein n=1 Tax=Acetobacter thailandicus TaxID=1502842 RepID=UPI001BA59C7E|nr:hypothetical protein [Acetobacter thailandicus]MBS0959976.1 hypothetical protein [Acetobacter thailandicus]
MSDLVFHYANSDLNSIATALQTAKIHLIDDTRHGLTWKEILQVVVTLFVGLFAGWIAWQQKEIAKESKEITKQKLKLEIFEKRMEIVEIIEENYHIQTDVTLFNAPENIIDLIYNMMKKQQEAEEIKKNIILDKYISNPMKLSQSSSNKIKKIKTIFSDKTATKIINTIEKLNELYEFKLDYITNHRSGIIETFKTRMELNKEIFLQKRIDIIQLYKLMWESLRENEFKGLSDW